MIEHFHIRPSESKTLTIRARTVPAASCVDSLHSMEAFETGEGGTRSCYCGRISVAATPTVDGGHDIEAASDYQS